MLDRGARVDEAQASDLLALPRGGLDERDLRIQHPPPPGFVVVVGPSPPAEQQHREIGVHDELELRAAADLIRRRPRERQDRLDRLAIRVGPIGREGEPQRETPRSPREVERVVARVP